MKGQKLVSTLGAIGILLASGAAAAESIESKMGLGQARAAEQKPVEAKKLQDFEAALPARLALVSSVIDQFRAEFARDGLDGMKRLSAFAAQVHATPSSVLQVTRFARNVAEFLDRTEKARADPVNAKALGDQGDLVFFAVGPCRIADSRYSSLGILHTGTIRNYQNFSQAGQGGDGVCNVSSGYASGYPGSIAMNIAATSVSGNGNLNVRPVGSTTVTSSLNFTTGQDISNATVIKMTGSGGFFSKDFEILPTVTGASGTVHVIIDLLGFYAPSTPTPLECVDTATTGGTTGASPGIETSATAPACAAGYTRVAMNCMAGNDATVTDVNVAGGSCSYAPRIAAATGFTVGARCCRVPGNAAGRF